MTKALTKPTAINYSKIKLEDITCMFDIPDDNISKETKRYFKGIDTSFKEPSMEEFEEYVLEVLKKINSSYIQRNREENLMAFESGWRENLNCIKSKNDVFPKALKPGYFRGSKFLRLNKGLVVPKNPDLEYELFTVVRYIIFNRYLMPFKDVYEIGAGSCQNLLLLSSLFPDKNLFGLD